MRIWQLGFVTSLALTACGEETKETKTETKKEVTAEAPAASEEDVGEVLARVNDVAIGSKDFERAASRKIPADGKSLSLEERKEVLDQLISEELLYQKAYERQLFRDPKVKKVMMNALLREDVYKSVKNSDITDEELEAYYNEHIDEFSLPEKVQFSRILIKVKADRSKEEAKAEADRIRGQLSKNTSLFKEVAEKTSEGPYRRRGGDVGFVSEKGKPGLDTELITKAFAMKKGQLSDAFETKEGYNIILLKERRAAQVRSFKTAQGTVMRKMKNAKISAHYENYTGELRSTASVNVDEEKLKAIEIKSSPRPSLGMPGMGMPKKGAPSLKKAVE